MKKALTLVELLVVISIIGILAAVVVVGFGQYRAKGRDAKRIADINLIASKVQEYFNEHKEYPIDQTIFESSIDYVPTGPNGDTYTYACAKNFNPDDPASACIGFTIIATLETGDPSCVGYDIYGADQCT